MIQVQVIVSKDILPAVLAKLNENTHRIIQAGMTQGAETADQMVPVDTGALRESGHVVDTYGSDQSLALVYDAQNTSGDPYGRYVEFGTRFMEAQPFIQPASLDAMSAMARNASMVLDI